MSTRVWFAREAQFTADPKIQMLGCEFGAAGPLVIEEVFAIAKLADDNGNATLLYAQIASRAFTTPGKARQIITRAGELGVLVFNGAPSPKGCQISLPRWARWQVKDATAATRKARQRDRASANGHSESHGAQRDISVTVTPPTVDRDKDREEGGGAGAPERDTILIGDSRLDETVGILQTAPRLFIDVERMGIANTLAAYPNADHVQAAHIAVANSSDPSYRTTDAAKALRYAIAELERQQSRGARPATKPPASARLSEREERQNRRRETAMRLATDQPPHQGEAA